MTSGEIINLWAARAIANGKHYAEFNCSIKLMIEGIGGTVSWIFYCKDPVSVIESEDDAECTVKMSEHDLLEMFKTRQNPQELFALGKISLSGDTLLGLRLNDLIEGVE